MHNPLTSIEICAGAGGQALGLERAGFNHLVAVEIDDWSVKTLQANRPDWNVIQADVLNFDVSPYAGADLFAGGVPCPPFSVAGQQLGAEDERDLFPRALEMVRTISPRAVMLENVKGLGQKKFDSYRGQIISQLEEMGYVAFWKLLQAADFGVPQLRPRFILVALKQEYAPFFAWPNTSDHWTTVGEALESLMGQNGWPAAGKWAKQANKVAPTLVGGSKKHGGPDVGPTRAKAAWKELGVKGTSIAESAPEKDFPTDMHDELPRLTVQMGGVVQGFPREWQWQGGKTAQWRQVGNAFPPPVAQAVGTRIAAALNKELLPDEVSAAEPTRAPSSIRI